MTDWDAAVRTLLVEAVTAPPADRIDLDRAVARGRRNRRRRLTVAVGGFASGALVLGVLAVQGLGLMGGDRVTTGLQPASVPSYTGPESVEWLDWPGVVEGLLPGRVVTRYGPDYAVTEEMQDVTISWRVERDGRTALVRAAVYVGGGGNQGVCAIGMSDCSPLTPSERVPNALIMSYQLDQEYAHESGHAVDLMRDPRTPIRVGEQGAVPNRVEVILTAVAADVGPGQEGWTVGMGVAAEPVLTPEELVAVVEQMPLPRIPEPDRQ